MKQSREARNEELRNAMEKRIVSAGITVFSQKSFDATKVQEIADEAGISVGSLYRHFKTKDEIFYAIVKLAMKDFEYLEHILSQFDCPKEAMIFSTEDLIKDLEEGEEGQFLQMMMLLTKPFLDNMQYEWMEELKDKNSYIVDVIANVIKKGQEQGKFVEGNPVQLAQHYFSSVQGMCITRHTMNQDLILPTTDMILAYLLK